MIQDIAPKKYVNHYEEQSPAAEDWMLVYRDGKVLCRFDNEKIYFPKVKEITQEDQDVTYLFTISDERFFLLKNGLDGELEGYVTISPYSTRGGTFSPSRRSARASWCRTASWDGAEAAPLPMPWTPSPAMRPAFSATVA